jgi:hypothetical protein
VGGSGGEQGRLGDKGGIAISAHLLPHGDGGGMGRQGSLGGGDGGGSGPLMLLLNSADLSAGNLLIAPFSCTINVSHGVYHFHYITEHFLCYQPLAPFLCHSLFQHNWFLAPAKCPKVLNISLGGAITLCKWEFGCVLDYLRARRPKSITGHIANGY